MTSLCAQCGSGLPPYKGKGRPKTKCDECRKVNQRRAADAWSKANRERHNTLQREWRGKNKDRVNKEARERYWLDPEASREKVRGEAALYRQRHPDRVKEQQRRRTAEQKRKVNLWAYYRMTPEDYELMLSSQGGCCKVCGSSDPKMKGAHFHIDHCHATGKIRGLLCGPCNVGLGAFYDNIGTLEAAIRYLNAATLGTVTEAA